MLLDDPDRIPDTAYLPPLLMVVLVLQMVLVMELDPERIGIVVFPDHPAMASITRTELTEFVVQADDGKIGIMEQG